MKSISNLISKKSNILLYLLCCTFLCQAQNWQKIELAPEFSQTSFTKIHFINDNEGLMISPGGTILRTDDEGSNWTEVQISVTHILYDMTFANENVGYINGLKTTDGGLTWTTQLATQSFRLIYAITENHLIASNTLEGNAYRESLDGGQTWEPVFTPPIPDQALYPYYPSDISFIDEETGYMSLRKGILESADTLRILKTSNGGNSWTPISVPAPVPVPDLGFNGFSRIAFPSENIGLVVHDRGVLKTSDGGVTFNEIIPNSIPDFWAPVMIHAASEDHYLLIGLKPFITDSIVSLYETFDGGLSWVEAVTAPGNEYLSDVFCTSTNCFASGDALYRKFDSNATSIHEFETEEIKIYPNPTTNYLHIDSDQVEIDEVQIFDFCGRLCLSYFSTSNEINITDLPRGLYLLKIRFGENEKILKFEKI